MLRVALGGRRDATERARPAGAPPDTYVPYISPTSPLYLPYISAQVEYQEVLSRIRAHGLLGDRSFDGLLKKTEEMMQAAEIAGRYGRDRGEMEAR